MTEKTEIGSRRIDRRTALSGIGCAVAALAGCLNETNTESTTSPSESPGSDSETFDGTEFDGGKLTVSIAHDVSVSWVRRIDPNGDLAEEATVSEDGKTSQFDLVGRSETYTPGEHTFQAIHSDDVVGEMTLAIRPDVTLTDLRWAKNYPEMDWPKVENNWETHAALLLENAGTGPALLTGTRWEDAPFTFRTDESVHEYDYAKTLPPGETTTVYSTAPVYEVSGGLVGASAVDCGEIDTERYQLTAVIEPGEDLTYSQTVRYGGERLNCDLEIVDGDG